MFSSRQIRNFCIIAHIDAGKSTLADRFLELTGAVEKDQLKPQHLDQMDLERERGITIKLQPVRLIYQPKISDSKIQDTNKPRLADSKFPTSSSRPSLKNSIINSQLSIHNYILNLVDTPGHVDFSYEVSRTLAVVEGAILLIDGTRGIQAQTLSVLEMALKQNLVIIPAINKIDLANVQIEKCRQEIKELLGDKAEKIFEISAKTGASVPELLEAIVERIPPPSPVGKTFKTAKTTPDRRTQSGLRALVFDSHYDQHRGVVAHIRIFDGEIKAGDRLKFFNTKIEDRVLEVGVFTPAMRKKDILSAGEIGYAITGLKIIQPAQVGDTLSLAGDENVVPLPGCQKPQPMVFASIFPFSQTDYPPLSQALEKLSLNDSSFEFRADHSPVLGSGFELGLLGLLHLDILLERIRREFRLDVLASLPSPQLKVISPDNRAEMVRGVWQLPPKSEIKELLEPYFKVKIFTPSSQLGKIMTLIQNFRVKLIDTRYLNQGKLRLIFEMPALEILRGFYDRLKSVSAGLASLSYQFDGFKPSDLERLDVRVADEMVAPLSILVPRDRIYSRARDLALKLKKLIPRASFEIKIQITQGGKIIASEKIPALRKDVIAGLYGGDVTRKRKLLEKQKKGKKKMQRFGRVEIPSEVLVRLLE